MGGALCVASRVACARFPLLPLAARGRRGFVPRSPCRRAARHGSPISPAPLAAPQHRAGARNRARRARATQGRADRGADRADHRTRGHRRNTRSACSDQWKLGRKNIDDGVLLIVAKNDHRELRIEVARGLEAVIPDAASARIIREYITPRFRAGRFLRRHPRRDADALTKLVDGEPAAAAADRRASERRASATSSTRSSGRSSSASGRARCSAVCRRRPRAGLVGAASGGARRG